MEALTEMMGLLNLHSEPPAESRECSRKTRMNPGEDEGGAPRKKTRGTEQCSAAVGRSAVATRFWVTRCTEGDDGTIPHEFVCPISLQLMQDPVYTVDHKTYDRESIEEWFKMGKITSPLTGADLELDGKVDTTLRPNCELQTAIHTWMNKQLQALKLCECGEKLSEKGGHVRILREISDFVPYVHAACATGCLKMLQAFHETWGRQLFVTLSATEDRSCLCIACRQNNLDVVRFLCKVGGKDLIMLPNCDGNSSLHTACVSGHFEIVEHLCTVGDKELVMKLTPDGRSCLHIACSSNHLAIVKHLSETFGRQLVFKTDSRGHSCLRHCLEKIPNSQGRWEIVEYLGGRWGKELVIIPDNRGISCLSAACLEGDIEIIKFLSEVGGRELAMMQDNECYSCLQVACYADRLDVTQYLCEKWGRELLFLSRDGLSCLHLACLHGSVDLVKYLSETWGKDLVVQITTTGKTCLHFACISGSLDTVKYLSEKWGKRLVMKLCGEFKTCLTWASMNGHLEVVQYLIDTWGEELLTRSFGSLAGAHMLGYMDVAKHLARVGGAAFVKRELRLLVEETVSLFVAGFSSVGMQNSFSGHL